MINFAILFPNSLNIEHTSWSGLAQQGLERIGTTYTSRTKTCQLSPQQWSGSLCTQDTQVTNAVFIPLSVQVPCVWSSRWDGLEDPAMYLRTVVAKALALSSWLQKSELGSLLGDEPLDLSELFNPATFLNALRQQTGRYVCTWYEVGHFSVGE